MAQEPENGDNEDGGKGPRSTIARSIIGSGKINSFREGIVDAVEAALEKKAVGWIPGFRKKPPRISEDFFSDKASIDEKRKTLGSYIQDHFFTEEYMRKNLHPSNAQVTNQQFYQWYDEVLEKLLVRLTAKESKLIETISQIRENLTQNSADYGVQPVEGEEADGLDNRPDFLRRTELPGMTASRTEAPGAKSAVGTDGDPDDDSDDDPNAVPEIVVQHLRTVAERQGDGAVASEDSDADAAVTPEETTEPAAVQQPASEPKTLFSDFNGLFGSVPAERAVSSRQTLDNLETHFKGDYNRGRSPHIVLNDRDDPDKKIHLRRQGDDAIARYVGDPNKFDAKAALAAAYSILEAEDRSKLDGDINVRLSGSKEQRALMQSALAYLHYRQYQHLEYKVSKGYQDVNKNADQFGRIQAQIEQAYSDFYNADDPDGDALKKAAEMLKTVPNEGEFTPEFSGTSNERVLLSAALQHIAGMTHPDLTILPGKGFIELSEQDFANAGVRILEAYKTFDKKLLPTPAPVTKPTDQAVADADADADADDKPAPTQPERKQASAKQRKDLREHVRKSYEDATNDGDTANSDRQSIYEFTAYAKALATAVVRVNQDILLEQGSRANLESVKPGEVKSEYQALGSDVHAHRPIVVDRFEGSDTDYLRELARHGFEQAMQGGDQKFDDLSVHSVEKLKDELRNSGITEERAREQLVKINNIRRPDVA